MKIACKINLNLCLVVFKLTLIFLVLLFSNKLSSQYKGIEVPKLKEVRTFDNVEFFIPIYIKSVETTRSIHIYDNKVTKINSIPVLIQAEINKVIEKNLLNIQKIAVELIVDRKFKMSEINDVLLVLKHCGMTQIILSARSEDYSRINQIWTTGIYHEFNEYAGEGLDSLFLDPSFVNLKSNSFSNYFDEYSVTKKDVSPDIRTSGPPPTLPPPPPPPASSANANEKSQTYPRYYTDQMVTNFPGYTYIPIGIQDSVFTIYDSKFKGVEDFQHQLSLLNIDQKTIFVLIMSQNATYQNFLELLFSYNQVVYNKREALSHKLFQRSYLDLDQQHKSNIEYFVPYYIIEKPF